MRFAVMLAVLGAALVQPAFAQTSDQIRRAWVDHVLSRCAAAVHENRELTAEEFAPFLEFDEVHNGATVLRSRAGQPAAAVSINGPAMCQIVAIGEPARLLDAAIHAVAAERGYPATERPRRLRMPKFLIARPEGQPGGHDAVVSTIVVMGGDLPVLSAMVDPDDEP